MRRFLRTRGHFLFVNPKGWQLMNATPAEVWQAYIPRHRRDISAIGDQMLLHLEKVQR
jgi:hypothetical protein